MSTVDINIPSPSGGGTGRGDMHLQLSLIAVGFFIATLLLVAFIFAGPLWLYVRLLLCQRAAAPLICGYSYLVPLLLITFTVADFSALIYALYREGRIRFTVPDPSRRSRIIGYVGSVNSAFERLSFMDRVYLRGVLAIVVLMLGALAGYLTFWAASLTLPNRIFWITTGTGLISLTLIYVGVEVLFFSRSGYRILSRIF